MRAQLVSEGQGREQYPDCEGGCRRSVAGAPRAHPVVVPLPNARPAGDGGEGADAQNDEGAGPITAPPLRER